MKLLNIKRSDYWDCEIGKLVTIYYNLTKEQLEDITNDLRELEYSLVKFENKRREFENYNSIVIIEGK